MKYIEIFKNRLLTLAFSGLLWLVLGYSKIYEKKVKALKACQKLETFKKEKLRKARKKMIASKVLKKLKASTARKKWRRVNKMKAHKVRKKMKARTQVKHAST